MDDTAPVSTGNAAIDAANSAPSQPVEPGGLDRLIRRLSAGWDAFDLVAGMTLILLLFHANETWYLRVAVTVMAAAGLLFRPLARQSAFWWILSAVLGTVYALNWDLWIVNHKFSMTYWCLAIACALLAPDPGPRLAVAARVLVGLFFAFATLWKVISPEFPDGTFFHFTLLTDPRFVNVAELAGGVPPEATQRNAEAVAALKESGPPAASVRLEDTTAVRRIAKFMAAWTIGIEGLIAAVFLWPGGLRFAWWRNWLLIVFIGTTFPIATVHGFAWLLTIMGLAQCDPSLRLQRVLYVLLFLLLPLFDVPFASALRSVAEGWIE